MLQFIDPERQGNKEGSWQETPISPWEGETEEIS